MIHFYFGCVSMDFFFADSGVRAALLRLAPFAIALPTACSTTLSETPLCTAFLMAFSIALTAFFFVFFLAITNSPSRPGRSSSQYGTGSEKKVIRGNGPAISPRLTG
jgi:hypothetical protein